MIGIIEIFKIFELGLGLRPIIAIVDWISPTHSPPDDPARRINRPGIMRSSNSTLL